MSYGKENTGNAFSSFLAIIPSLAQVVAVVAIGFTDKLGLSKILARPDLVPLMNVLAILLSLSLIGVLNFWKENLFLEPVAPKIHGKIISWLKKLFIDNSQTPRQQLPLEIFQSRRRKLIWRLFIFQILSFLSFVVSIFINYYQELVQSISYVAFLILSAGLIFIWAKEITDKNKQFKIDDFMPNFQGALLSYGMLKNTLKVICNADIGSGQRIIKTLIEDENIYLIVSYDGKQILYEVSETDYQNILNKIKKDKLPV